MFTRCSIKPASRVVWVVMGCLLSTFAIAGQAWLETGDAGLRDDLQLLRDARVIELPVAAWPIPVADIERALAAVDDRGTVSSGQSAALVRLRRAIRSASAGYLHNDLLRASAGQEALLRDFDTAAREEGEFTAGLAALGNRWAMEARATVVASAADERSIRMDGTHLTVRFGNWLIGANILERWWGPGHVSSLILSNNARPIPALALERATSTAFRAPLLRWIGPWRMSAFLGRMESGRADYDNPLLLGTRISIAPLRILEIGVSRTAQFCGEGRFCNMETFRDVLGFNDTAGVTVSPDKQPGNQLAGYDVRAASPWKRLPVALYTQDIGEDRVGFRPTDRLKQYGLEVWHEFAHGSVLRGYVEYSDSTCAARSDPVFNCAYNSSVFFADGYRYFGRSVGHTTDNDAQLRAGGVRWRRTSGDAWSLKLRDGTLNRDSAPDANNTLSSTPLDYSSAELGWQGEYFASILQAQVGVERLRPSIGSGEDRAFGFLSWRRQF